VFERLARKTEGSGFRGFAKQLRELQSVYLEVGNSGWDPAFLKFTIKCSAKVH